MWHIIGQPQAVSLLESSLKRGQLCHAYLFVGPPRVGKMTLALDLAQALNCAAEAPPCAECPACRRIAAGKHADVRVIGLNSNHNGAEGRPKAEIGIDEIKELRNAAFLPPYEGKHKVFIIDGAEQLSSEAANCLLKTLEEPPPQVLLILLATKERFLLPTIVSRCQRLELHPLSRKAVAEALAEQRGTDAQKAKLVASLSGGCLGWALAAEGDDRLLAQRSQKIAELLQVAAAGYEERFAYAAQLATRFGHDRPSALDALKLWLSWWHDLLLVKTGCGDWITNVDQEAVLLHQAAGYKLAQIKGAIDSLQAAGEQLERNANPRLALEVLMLNLPLKRG